MDPQKCGPAVALNKPQDNAAPFLWQWHGFRAKAAGSSCGTVQHRDGDGVWGRPPRLLPRLALVPNGDTGRRRTRAQSVSTAGGPSVTTTPRVSAIARRQVRGLEVRGQRLFGCAVSGTPPSLVHATVNGRKVTAPRPSVVLLASLGLDGAPF